MNTSFQQQYGNRSMPCAMPAAPAAQRGAVLIIGLILLAALTIVGTSSMTSVTLEERMVSNMQNATKAFHGAEVGLSNCEASLLNDTATVYEYGAFTADKWREDKAFWQSTGDAAAVTALVQSTANPDGLVAEPRCVVEFIGDGMGAKELEISYSGTPFGSRPVYRATAFSQGADDSSEAVVESMFICGGGCTTDTTALGGS